MAEKVTVFVDGGYVYKSVEEMGYKGLLDYTKLIERLVKRPERELFSAILFW